MVWFFMHNKVYVTCPTLPNSEDLIKLVGDIYERKWITNFGFYEAELLKKLKDFLDLKYLNLTSNGTSALMIALKALNLPKGSEVITSPFTFIATSEAIVWNNLVPVFCDIRPDNFTINAEHIESLITKKTKAILGIHVYGYPCDVIKIRDIARQYKLKVIYDAAHAFNTRIDDAGIGRFGDVSAFSFHATKLFNTIEGGGISSSSSFLSKRIKELCNFGISSEEKISYLGLNAKMNEIEAAWGLCNLKNINLEIKKRKKISELYKSEFTNLPYIKIFNLPKNITNSYQYFPIRVFDKETTIETNRDKIYLDLKNKNIYSRKYFNPICSDVPFLKKYKKDGKLSVANLIKKQILCLPFYGDLSNNDIERIIESIKKYGR